MGKQNREERGGKVNPDFEKEKVSSLTRTHGLHSLTHSLTHTAVFGAVTIARAWHA